MSKFSIQLHDKGRCRIRHELADAEIITDLPPEYGGHGRPFYSTDLVSVALGTCILTSIDSIYEHTGYDPKKIRLSVIIHPHSGWPQEASSKEATIVRVLVSPL